LRFPDLSISTPNNGENNISSKALPALAYAITVDDICSSRSSVPIISVMYCGKNKVTMFAENIVLAKSKNAHASIGSDKIKLQVYGFLASCIYFPSSFSKKDMQKTSACPVYYTIFKIKLSLSVRRLNKV